MSCSLDSPKYSAFVSRARISALVIDMFGFPIIGNSSCATVYKRHNRADQHQRLAFTKKALLSKRRRIRQGNEANILVASGFMQKALATIYANNREPDYNQKSNKQIKQDAPSTIKW